MTEIKKEAGKTARQAATLQPAPARAADQFQSQGRLPGVSSGCHQGGALKDNCRAKLPQRACVLSYYIVAQAIHQGLPALTLAVERTQQRLRERHFIQS